MTSSNCVLPDAPRQKVGAGGTAAVNARVIRVREFQVERISSRMAWRTTSAMDKPSAYCFKASFIMV